VEGQDLVFQSQVSRGINKNSERKSQIIMNLLVKNFLGFLVVVFLFVALGQWNNPKFQQKAYDLAKEAIVFDLEEKGEKAGDFIESPDGSVDLYHVGIVTEKGTEHLYDVSVLNPLWVQLSALNLMVSPRVEITHVDTSRP